MFKRIFNIFTPIQWGEMLLIAAVIFTVFNFASSASDSIKEKFGFETKATLKEKTIQQEAVIKTVVDVNKDLIETIEKKEESSKVDINLVIDKVKSDVSTEKVIKKIVTKKDKEILEIKKSYEDTPQTELSQTQMESEVSEKQITSLWSVFCSDIENQQQCNTV